MLTIPAPVVLNGDLLAGDLQAAGLPSRVVLSGAELQLPDLDESNRASAQAVVDAHPPTAQAALDQAAAEQSNETSIRDKATQALQVNRDFLALTSPSNAQVVAQVKALTRQNNALIRLALGRFDAAD